MLVQVGLMDLHRMRLIPGNCWIQVVPSVSVQMVQMGYLLFCQ